MSDRENTYNSIISGVEKLQRVASAVSAHRENPESSTESWLPIGKIPKAQRKAGCPSGKPRKPNGKLVAHRENPESSTESWLPIGKIPKAQRKAGRPSGKSRKLKTKTITY